MILITDTMLCAYIDGELPADQRAEIERLVEADLEVAARLALFREVTEAVQNAYGLYDKPAGRS